jgi:transposase InsO family protein
MSTEVVDAKSVFESAVVVYAISRKEHALMSHRNARLTPWSRWTIVEDHRQRGLPAARIAEGMRVSRATVSKWLKRFTEEGRGGLEERSSRPHQSPRRIPDDLAAQIVCLRLDLGYGPARIARELGMAASTVYRVLCRLELNRLDLLHRSTREPVRRYERTSPGELVHLDTKRLGRIPDGGGKRMDPVYVATGIGRQGKRGYGYDTLHVAIDDYSRLAYVEVLPDGGKESAAGFLAHTLQAFAAAGVRIQRVITDNALAYRSNHFRDVADAADIQLRRTRPYRPQTNGKAERFIQTLLREWAYLRPYTSNDARLLALDDFLDEYNFHRPHSALGHQPPASRVYNLCGQHT